MSTIISKTDVPRRIRIEMQKIIAADKERFVWDIHYIEKPMSFTLYTSFNWKSISSTHKSSTACVEEFKEKMVPIILHSYKDEETARRVLWRDRDSEKPQELEQSSGES